MASASSRIFVLALLLAAACGASAISGYHVREAVVKNTVGWYDCSNTCTKVLGSNYRKINGGNSDTAFCAYSIYYGVKTALPGDNRFGCAIPYVGYARSNYNCLCTDNASKLAWARFVKYCPRTFPYPIKYQYTVCRYLDSSGRYWLGYLNGNYCKVASARDGKAYQKSVHYTIASILCSKP